MYSRQVRRQIARQITRNGTLRTATHYPRALRRQSKYLPHTKDKDGNIIMAKCLGGNHLI